MSKPATLTYLASPYSHPDPAVREQRFLAACRAAAHLMRQGKLVFCPVAHSHPIAVHGGLDGDWETWREWCLAMLDRCDEFVILKLDGWSQSRGIAEELLRWMDKGDLALVKSVEPEITP